GRHEELVRSLIDLLVVTLVADEEKQFIAIAIELGPGQQNRATDITTRIVVLAKWAGDVVDTVRAIVSLESIIANVVVNRTVELRATTFRGRTDLHRARTMFGSVVAGLNFYFLHHVRIRSDDRSVVRSNVDHAGAVDRDVVLFAAQTIYVILRVRISAAAERNTFKRSVIRGNYAWENA